MSELNASPMPEPEQETEKKIQPQFMVVGIGASAGGLAGLKSFFDNTPADTGLAFVVVMHLAPEYQSHLPELLQTHTKMPVVQVSQTMEMVPNHVYVIPPNRNLAAIDTHLRLSELEEMRQQRAPIDHFFRTLASAHGPQAIGVILSGTGADGSLGLKQIKELGGLTVVQDPSEAEYNSMPQNAIATGVIDLILPVAEMPSQITSYVHVLPDLPALEEQQKLPETEEDILQKIFVHLRTHTSHDFSSYKQATIMRRVQRRMQLHQMEELTEYLDYLRKHPEETQVLFRDLLITVTNFFRDIEAYAALENLVIPQLFEGKRRENVVRVWVIGCATGEEAYSVAMLLLEQRNRIDDPPEIQVFASDISEEALARAREGIYPAVIAADMSPERLTRFFQEDNGVYRVKKELREVVLFAEHNLLSDPPFSRLDLITCRNLLIYLQRDIQNKITELFHYALRPGGYLFLGTSESVSTAELFRALDKKLGLYQRQTLATRQFNPPSVPLVSRPLALLKTADRDKALKQSKHDSFGALHQEVVEQYAPPSLLVNEDFNIVHLSQHAGRYLYQPGGEPTNSILQRVRPALRTELTAALYGAFEKDRPLRTKPVSLALEGEMRRVMMSVHPVLTPELAGHILIVFLETEDMAMATHVEELEGGGAMSGVVQELEEELVRTKERLQTAVEEFESSKEEMRASNEELQSMNEELRSTAEELETSKEELQSMNEELLTVNQENKNKVEELSQLSSDLQNLLASTDIATLFLDRDLCIRRFTPRISDLFNIMPADRGRPLAHITHKLRSNTLMADAATVLDNLALIEREMVSEDGRWYLVRLRPYRSVEDRIEGVVITFIEVTEMKHALEELQVSKAFREHIVNTVQDGLLVLDKDLKLVFANQSFYNMFHTTEEETLDRLIYELGEGQWDIPELHTLLESTAFTANEITQEFLRIGTSMMRINGRRLDREQGILLAITDITAQEQALADLQQLNNTLEDEVAQRTREIRSLAAELLVAERKVREHIAQTLHDEMQQMIYSMRMQLQVLARSLQSTAVAELAEQISDLDKMMEIAFTTSRQIAYELMPPIQMAETLDESMRQLAAYLKDLHALDTEVTIHGEVAQVDDEMRFLLFQIVRELLFNVVKHAAVGSAVVNIEQEGRELTVSVEDRGKGFNAAELLSEGEHARLGLYSINERLGLVNGRLEIHSAADEGTRIVIHLPLST